MADETTESTLDRRKFLTVLGVAGGGAAVLSGCSTDRVQKLIPYLVQSEDQVPGVATFYASTCTECPAGCGVHVRTREGRAVKLEGNPDHPVNAGTLCARGQAALQGLYNPGRVRAPLTRQADGSFKAISWDDAIALLAGKLAAAQGKVAVISGAGRGTFTDLLATWARAVGGKLVRYEPFDFEPMRAANRQVFGLDQLPAHDFAKARYIASFGADFLETWLSPTENQRGFAAAHGYHDRQMARHVSFAPRLSLTAMNADRHFTVRPGSEAAVALAMAGVILSERSGAPGDASALKGLLEAWTPEKAAEASGLSADGIRRVAREFASAAPSLAVAGGVGSQHRGAVQLCAAVNILNYVAGNVGQTVLFGADLQSGDGYAALAQLADGMAGGQYSVAIVHEANPAYATPRTLDFAGKFAKVPFKVALAVFANDTTRFCDLVLPIHHALERWDDLRPRAGVASLMQPVMQPVFDSQAAGDILLQVAQKAGGALAAFNAPSWEAYLKQAWAAFARQQGSADAEGFWRAALGRGGVFTAVPPVSVRLASGAAPSGWQAPALDGAEGADSLVLSAYPTSMLYDGRSANRSWLREMSDPVTKVTWHSWVEIHPDVAARMNVQDGEVLTVTSPYGTLEAPALLYAGLHPDLVAIPLGLGHGTLNDPRGSTGVNALDLLGGQASDGFLPYTGTRVTLATTGRYHQLARTEGTPRQLGRGLSDAMTLDQARKGMTPALAAAESGGHPEEEVNTEGEVRALEGWREGQRQKTLLGAYAEDFPRWGMSIDLSRCTGCSACVAACYAENNIPTVGEAEILRGREMTWIRIERYWEGGEEPGEPLEARFLPMMCQQCANAPCEPVCPVYAAYHTADGLNGQVYNRCVGTRYCSNNCPYKVRYFNWFAYNRTAFPEPLNLQLNPDVTVRARGVMEKCTFCVQRIRGAQNTARLEDRPLADGDVITACAQACPSGAIAFGNVKDPASRINKVAADSRGYHVFEDLNVRPSVTYLARVLDPVEA
jgi:anaerobic selenocysteine-containing dehydrogenase/Fe-S-cluster-containing dehydrogenase component